MKKLIIALIAGILALGSAAQAPRANYRVVPLPERIDGIKNADFRLTEACLVNYPTGNRDMERNAIMLSEYIEELTGMHLSVRPTVNSKDRAGNISLLIDPKVKDKEGYCITVTAKGIEIAGQTPSGVFHGIQTLRKSLPVNNTDLVLMPSAQVAANPRFPYRGMHLDCSRHFFPVSTVKRYIDLLALHGMNKLHWHLTDDQGWRVEIKKYPRLTEVGGWRNGTTLGHNSPVNDGIRYGGYYTQEEIRDIVRYAADAAENETLRAVLLDILDTPVSPELLPANENGEIAQQTESLVGPYELHDFYLYYVLRFGFGPAKIYRLARHALGERYPDDVLLHWLKNFYRRFFVQQFKRSCLPDGPKIGSITLSPRGDWRMPSDACAAVWQAELDQLG